MKAAIYTQYGNSDVINVKEIEKPEMGDDQVCVKIHASSINYADNATLTGKPFLIRMVTGLFKPRKNIFGMDFSGVVVEVGKNVENIKAGDEVFGDLSDFGMGAYAEYKCIEPEKLVKKSAKISHEEAAAIPLAGITALQGLRDYGQIKKGMKILINGASGGVGSFAIQIAKDYGATVTAIAHRSKIDALKSCGADEMIDYTETDLAEITEKYDIIYDCAMYQPPKNFKHLLKDDGIYIGNGGAMKHVFKILLFGKMMSQKNGKRYSSYLAKFSKKDLEYLNTMAEEGRLKPLICKRFELDQIKEAFDLYQSREAYGKIVIKVS